MPDCSHKFEQKDDKEAGTAENSCRDHFNSAKPSFKGDKRSCHSHVMRGNWKFMVADNGDYYCGSNPKRTTYQGDDKIGGDMLEIRGCRRKFDASGIHGCNEHKSRTCVRPPSLNCRCNAHISDPKIRCRLMCTCSDEHWTQAVEEHQTAVTEYNSQGTGMALWRNHGGKAAGKAKAPA